MIVTEQIRFIYTKLQAHYLMIAKKPFDKKALISVAIRLLPRFSQIQYKLQSVVQ